MNRRIRHLLLAALSAVVVPAALGCGLCGDEKALQAKIDSLEASNVQMHENLRQCNEQRAQAERERDSLATQLQLQNTQIVDLQTQLAARPRPLEPLPTQPRPDAGRDLAGADREVETVPGMILVTMPGDMLFASGRADLTPQGRKVVDEIADVLRTKYAGKTVRVVGHTDSDPIRVSGWKDNWDLSFHRARAVGLALIARGVSEKNVEMVGVANNAPRVSPERTAADKARNRRVVIQVVQ